ncbi:hypothetical protein F4818DRAFT_446195 [Hypoxylon cercidicola]|nr:hypothetical protein F4818DRAFT_446195 [Hypoxylon cercidicola]
MAPNLELITRRFEKDVQKRGVTNPLAHDSCKCGQYQYHSQKCGCVYKSVFLKCGETVSKKTGDPILCRAGRGRIVKVQDVLVPFYCPKCRYNNVRWTGKAATSNEKQEEGEVKIKEEEQEIKIKEED